MHDARKNASAEDAKLIARQCAMRRAERVDIAIAATLLALLIFGWAIRLAPIEQWPHGDFLVVASTRHA